MGITPNRGNDHVVAKLWYLLTPQQRSAAVMILGLMLIGMFLEVLGIGLIIPALALMTQSDLVTKYPGLAQWTNRLGDPSREQLIISGMLILAGVSTVKVLFLAYAAFRQARFASMLQADLSQRLFNAYLYQPYPFHLRRNSAQLIVNTIGQASNVSGVVQQGMIMAAELLVLTGASILLLSVEPMGAALVVSTLGLAAFGFTRLTRQHILRWGTAYKYHEGKRHQHIQHGLGGAKEVKLLGRESEFVAQYRAHTIGATMAIRRQAALQALPRLWLEWLAVVGLVTLVLVMIRQGKPMDTLLPILGVFAAAAFRVLPSIGRVLGAKQGVRFLLPAVDNLYSEFRTLDRISIPESSKPLLLNSDLSVEHVSFQYDGAENQALQDVSLSVCKGATVGIIGGSGSGKSTLVDIILGLLVPTSGLVKIDGVDIQTSIRGWQDQIGYVPQSIFLTDDSLRRNIAFGLPDSQIDEAAVRRAIRDAQLEEFILQLPQGLDTSVGERGVRLSGGQRQRIGIARALYHDPSVLVLDEATSALDVTTEKQVMESVRAMHGNKTIIIVAHRFSTLESCDRIFRLEAGRIVESGSPVIMLTNRPKET